MGSELRSCVPGQGNQTLLSNFNIAELRLIPLSSWLRRCGYVLFGLILFLPTAVEDVKVALLSLVTIGFAIELYHRSRVVANQTILIIGLITIAYGIFSVLLGFSRGAPGAANEATVFVLWPVLFLSLTLVGIRSERVIQWLFLVLLVSTVIIILHTYLFLLSNFGYLPSWAYVEVPVRTIATNYHGSIAYSISNITSLIFLVPFLMAGVLTWSRKSAPIPYRLTILTLLGVLPLVLFSGRRAFQLVVIGSVVTIFLLQLFLSTDCRPTIRWKATGVAVVTSSLAFLIIIGHVVVNGNVSYLPASYQAILNPLTTASMSARVAQLGALIAGWQEYPLFGVGHGIPAEVIRSTNSPWNYELTYVKLLYHTGIVGILVYGGAVAWLYMQGARLITHKPVAAQYLIPLLTGLTAFLIASASNPYLPKFSGVWTIFFCVGVINFFCTQLEGQS